MKILAVSDIELDIVYSPNIARRFADVDVVISCGDLPYYYLEYIISSLDVPLYYVRGNHSCPLEYSATGVRTSPWGGIDLHLRCRRDESGLLLAGIEGCLRYNNARYQYTQAEMWFFVWRLVPVLLWNRLRYGRFLDVFVTHAPPWKIHDQDDLPHRGLKAFHWLVRVFQPYYHLHGHVHVIHPRTITATVVNRSRVINTYGCRLLSVDLPHLAPTPVRLRRRGC